MNRKIRSRVINKFIKPEEVEIFFSQLREKYLKQGLNLKLVFTNGCFDILHRGHLEYLIKAKELGNKLIVAINSDNSVKLLKGEGRPINKLEDRIFFLSSLFYVDYVTYFEDKIPVEIIKKIKPDIHVKGGDYIKEELPEYFTVKKYGGEIIILDYIKGYSTTNIINNIKKN